MAPSSSLLGEKVWNLCWSKTHKGFPGGAGGEEPARPCRRHKRCGNQSLGGGSPGGGHGNPLQCSCLENPTDRGAWRATVPGVARSRTRLERLSMQQAQHTRGFLPETWSLETGIQVPQMTAVPSAWAGRVLLFPVHQLCFPSGGSQGPSEGTATRRGAQI